MPRLDPRTGPAFTTNQKIQDRSIRHLLGLLRLQNNEAREIVRFIEREVMPDLLDRVSAALARMELSGGAISGVEARRLQELSNGLDEILKRLSGVNNQSARDELARRMGNIAGNEARGAAGALQQNIPINWEIALPEISNLRSLVLNQPFDGATMNEWFHNLGENTRNKIMRQVRIGMVEGEGMGSIARRIRGTRAAGYTDGVLKKDLLRHADAITRSAVIHASTTARMETYRANDDLVKGVSWVATLDSRTCEVCGSLDGHEYPLESGPRPPVHVSCRCVVTPVVKSWRELGIDLDEAPIGTRAAMDGQVPGRITYPEWLANQSDAIQREALGATRYRLWKEGKFKIGDFVNDRNQVMTIQQLERQTPGIDVPEYRAVSSRAEAEGLARKWGFDSVDYGGFPLEMANNINEGIHWSVQQFGLVAGDLIFKKTASRGLYGRLQQIPNAYRTSEGVRFDFNPTYNISTFGRKIDDVQETFLRGLQRNGENGFFYQTPTVQSISAHEMGHYYMTRIYNNVYGSKGMTARVKAQYTRDWNAGIIPREIIDDALQQIGQTREYLNEVYGILGRYSRENAHETISMAIQYEFDNPGKLPFARAIINQMKKRL